MHFLRDLSSNSELVLIYQVMYDISWFQTLKSRIHVTFKAIGAEVWISAMGQNLFLQFYLKIFTQMNFF